MKHQPTLTGLTPLAVRIFQHMSRAGSISAREAMADYGLTSATLTRRICDIEAQGFDIIRERRAHPTNNKRYTRYSIKGIPHA